MKIESDYLYPRKAKLLKERYARFEAAEHPLQILTLHDAVVVPPFLSGTNDCGVVDKDGRFVGLSKMDPEDEFRERIGTRVESCGVKESDKRVLFAGYFNTHWGHFLMDTVSRLWPLFNPRVTEDIRNIDRIVYCIRKGDKPNLSGNVGRILALLGVADKIEFVDTPCRYRSVVIPETGVYPREIFAMDVKGVYDCIVERSLAERSRKEGEETGTSGRKLYLSRGCLKKALDNEPGIKWMDRWMEASGYEVIYPEKIDIAELVEMLHGADVVAAVQGTLPHNMVFAPEKSQLIIFEKYPTINNYQQGVNLLRNLKVTPVDCGAFIRPVNGGLGPFILYPTKNLRALARTHKMAPIAQLTDREKRRLLWQFFRRFRQNYHEKWVMPDWLIEETALCCEAYAETEKEFGEWLDGLRLVRLTDLLSIRDMARRIWRKLRKYDRGS